MDAIITQYGPGIALLYIILKEIVAPAFKKFVPFKAKAMAFEQQMQLRTVEALEELKKNSVQQTELFRVTNDRLSLIEHNVRELQKVSVPRKPKKVV